MGGGGRDGVAVLFVASGADGGGTCDTTGEYGADGAGTCTVVVVTRRPIPVEMDLVAVG